MKFPRFIALIQSSKFNEASFMKNAFQLSEYGYNLPYLFEGHNSATSLAQFFSWIVSKDR
jgi:hypothetical protein